MTGRCTPLVDPRPFFIERGRRFESPEGSAKARKSRLFLLKELAEAPVCGGYGALMELSDQKDRSERLAFEREAGVSTRLRSSATPIRRFP
jgi:hypothetical protein